MKKKLNIVFYCPFIASGKGGLERVGVEVANAMSQRGHRVTLAYHNRRDAIPFYPVLNEVELLPWDERDLYSLREKLIFIDPDIFFVFNSGWGFKKFCHLIDGTGIPFAIQESTNPERLIGDQWAVPLKISREKAAWERELVISAAVRIRMVRGSFARTLPAYVKPQVRVFPNAVQPANNFAKPEGIDVKRKTIINIGGLKKVKNLLPLLQAFRRLAPDFPDWDLKVFGSGFEREQKYQEKLFDFVNEHNLSNQVFFPGNSDEIYREYEKAHLHVTTSLNENGPLCVMEAMVHALPSIGFVECAGTNELINNTNNGLLVSASDEENELEKGLRKLMNAPQLRVTLGRKALQDSVIFEPNNIYDHWEELLFEAASYKDKPERLLKEQAAVSRERALHSAYNRKKIY